MPSLLVFYVRRTRVFRILIAPSDTSNVSVLESGYIDIETLYLHLELPVCISQAVMHRSRMVIEVWEGYTPVCLCVCASRADRQDTFSKGLLLVSAG